VIGNDVDDAMRDQSAKRCSGLSNVSVAAGQWTEVAGPFDLVTMVAVLHHLDVEAALREVRRLLAPGGRYLAVGLAMPRSFRDHLWDTASMVTNPIIGFLEHQWPSRAGVQPPPFSVQDPKVSFDELRIILNVVMPGAVIRHHLGFRHTIAWTKP
jgi:SAM-dependent methyltransferase